MRVMVLENTDFRSGSRLDFAFNLQVQQNQKLTSSKYDWKRLDDLATDICDGPRQADLTTEEGIPYVRLGALNVGDITATEAVFVSDRHIKERFRLRCDDILLSKTSNEPRAALVTNRSVGATFSPDIFRLRVNSRRISAAWVSLFFNTRYATRVFSQRAYGARIKRLRLSDLRHIRIPAPPRDLAEEVEILERQAQGYSVAAQTTFATVIKGLYGEIDMRVGDRLVSSQKKWLRAKNDWLRYRWDVPYVRSRNLVEALRRTGIFEEEAEEILCLREIKIVQEGMN